MFFICTLIGCAPSLKMTNNQIASLTPDEGLVFGSIQMKLTDDDKNTFWKISLDLTTWHFIVYNNRRLFQKIFGREKFEVNVVAGGEETIFVTKLPAGDYIIRKAIKNGFSSWEGPVGKSFTVEAGQTIYIGRLIATFPKYTNPYVFMTNYEVENAQAETLSMIESSYSNLGGDIKRS